MSSCFRPRLHAHRETAACPNISPASDDEQVDAETEATLGKAGTAADMVIGSSTAEWLGGVQGTLAGISDSLEMFWGYVAVVVVVVTLHCWPPRSPTQKCCLGQVVRLFQPHNIHGRGLRRHCQHGAPPPAALQMDCTRTWCHRHVCLHSAVQWCVQLGVCVCKALTASPPRNKTHCPPQRCLELCWDSLAIAAPHSATHRRPQAPKRRQQQKRQPSSLHYDGSITSFTP